MLVFGGSCRSPPWRPASSKGSSTGGSRTGLKLISFRKVDVRFLNEPEERLAVPEDPLIAGNVRRLNELLFGPLDYAIVART